MERGETKKTDFFRKATGFFRAIILGVTSPPNKRIIVAVKIKAVEIKGLFSGKMLYLSLANSEDVRIFTVSLPIRIVARIRFLYRDIFTISLEERLFSVLSFRIFQGVSEKKAGSVPEKRKEKNNKIITLITNSSIEEFYHKKGGYSPPYS